MKLPGIFKCVGCILLFGAQMAMADVPNTLSHQGVIAVNGARFSGDGAFRFALVDPNTGHYFWTNDGSVLDNCIPAVGMVPCVSTACVSPVTAVPLTVINGIYNVRLGDTSLVGMTGLPTGVFNENDDVVLRIWFDDGNGNGVHQFCPDQPVGSVPFTHHAEASERLNIPDTDTTAVFVDGAGSVGIGETNPEQRLVVSSDAATTALRIQSKGDDGIPSFGDEQAGIEFWGRFFSGNDDIIPMASITTVKESANGTFGWGMAFSTNSNSAPFVIEERVRIAEDGNVGIGTTDPTVKLDVAGTVRGTGLTVDGTVDGTGFSGWDTNAGNDLTTSTSFLGDVTGDFNSTVVGNDSHTHENGTVSDNISINNSRLYAPAGVGNVGIGETNPEQRLVVSSDAATTALRIQSKGVDGVPDFGDEQAGLEFWGRFWSGNNEIHPMASITTVKEAANGAFGWGMAFSTNSNSFPFEIEEHVRIAENGDVGIGTPNPSGRLHVVGGSGNGSVILPDESISTAEIATDSVNSGHLQSDAASLAKVSGGFITAIDGAVSVGHSTGKVPNGTYSPGVVSVGSLFFDRFLDGNGADAGVRVRIPNSTGDGFARIYFQNIVGSGYATLIGFHSEPSDMRLKQNVRPLENSLAKLARISGVSFERKQQADMKPEVPRSIGLIAQDVEKEFPELVYTGADDIKAISYSNMVGVLVEATKELKTLTDDSHSRIECLKAEKNAQIERQAREIADLNARIQRIEAAMR